MVLTAAAAWLLMWNHQAKWVSSRKRRLSPDDHHLSLLFLLLLLITHMLRNNINNSASWNKIPFSTSLWWICFQKLLRSHGFAGIRSFKLTIGSKESAAAAAAAEEEEHPHKSLTNGSSPRFGYKWSRQER
jgi:hypothetical protein